MNTIVVENARSVDIDSVKKLEAEAGLCAWSREDYLQEINGNNELFLVAKKDRKPIGFVLARLIIIEQIPFPRYEAEIYNIAVSLEYRREKIASQIINKLIEKACRYGAGKVFLEVRESNVGAQKFYARNSFKTIGVRKNFYTNPRENAILMCRELAEEKNM